jgi:hypothetical protein
MTFGAMAAWQAWLLLVGAAAIAAGLFLIKLRPPRMLVPSLLLWRRVLDEARELTLWERIRRAVSLIVTIVIALLLALAAARPGRIAGAADVATGRLLIVLDSSWSMQAQTQTGETRWERGIAEARRLLAAASGGEVALATTADGLVEGPTTDGALIETGLDRIAPGGGEGSAWPRLAGAAAVHFITDGANPRPLDSTVVVHSVFEAAPNLAITAFEVRPSLAPQNAGDAYLEIANFAPSAQKIRLTLVRGTATIFDRPFDVAGSETLRQVVPISRGGDPMLRAHIDVSSTGDNALTVDDDAVIWVDRARPLVVKVVGTQTDWLRAAFDRNPDLQVSFVSPGAYRPAAGPQAAEEDVVVFDRWAPPDPPRRPAFLFAPPASTAWLAGAAPDALPGVPAPARDEPRPRWEIPGTHPVVAGVDPFTMTIEHARSYSSPSLRPVVQSTRGTPLVYVSESSAHRFVVVTFGPDESNLIAAPGFPILAGNALDWLARPVAGIVRRPGLATFDAGIVKVTGPRGTGVRLSRVNDRAVGLLRLPGLYVAEGGGSRSTLAVNAGDPQLSNLMRTFTLSARQTRAVTAGASGRPWWLYCAMAAFILALVEWWTWQRRITV